MDFEFRINKVLKLKICSIWNVRCFLFVCFKITALKSNRMPFKWNGMEWAISFDERGGMSLCDFSPLARAHCSTKAIEPHFLNVFFFSPLQSSSRILLWMHNKPNYCFLSYLLFI